MGFMQALRARWEQADSLVCVGLDPEPAKFPSRIADAPDAIFEFCRDIVDATAQYVCCFKPQIAHFAALGAEDALQRLIAHVHSAHPGIPVILDSKRGDIGSTARHYAAEAFDRYAADAVTANPYLGRDSVQPFLDRADRGVVILCRTSNPGATDLQDLLVSDGGRVGEAVFDALRAELSDEQILEFTYVTALYDMHATMCRALRLEYDDRDEPIVEIAAPEGFDARDIGINVVGDKGAD